ncbi:MAG: transposase [Synergistaceae bacterium]|nr:transposase [Synergistaceae bacterium]
MGPKARYWLARPWRVAVVRVEKNISEAELRRALNAKKRTEFPWMLEVTKCAPHDSFYVFNDQFAVRGRQIRVRQWTCPQCGAKHDHDVNAAINLKQHAVSSTVSACGELGAVRPSMKQEVNINAA